MSGETLAEPTMTQFKAASDEFKKVCEDLDVDWVARNPIQGEATHKVFGYRLAKAALNAAPPTPVPAETLAERVAALADEWTNKADDASLKSANCVSDDDSDHWHAVSENYTHFAAGVRALLAPVPAEPVVADRFTLNVCGDCVTNPGWCETCSGPRPAPASSPAAPDEFPACAACGRPTPRKVVDR